MAAGVPVVSPRPLSVAVCLTTRLAVDRPPVAFHQAEVGHLQGLAVLRQTGPGLLVASETMVLHHAGQKGNKVRILPRLAAHSTCEATLGVSGLALTQTVEDVHTLGVCGAGGELQETMGHDTEDPLASHY